MRKWIWNSISNNYENQWAVNFQFGIEFVTTAYKNSLRQLYYYALILWIFSLDLMSVQWVSFNPLNTYNVLLSLKIHKKFSWKLPTKM